MTDTAQICTGDACTVEPFAALPAWQHAYFAPREIDAFNWQLYAHFSSGRLFVAAINCTLNVDKLLEAHRQHLQRGAQLDGRKKGRPWSTEHRQLLFEIEPDVFVYTNSNVSCLRVFARDPQVAETTARFLAEKFREKPRRKPRLPRFHMISITGNMIDTAAVEVRQKVRRSDAEISLLYGTDFLAWEKSLVALLQTKGTGMVLLRGEPGVGKTSFVRHLLSRLQRTHRFYFLPSTSFELLTTPGLVEFWSQEARSYPNLQKVVVLEDSEALLVDRSAGSRGPIANLLNISDGLLGDFLRMQIVCTLNCELGQIDPAIARSGRLLATWNFKRLSPEHAEQVATAHRLSLPPQSDYSLAEIFHGSAKAGSAPARRLLGFGAHLAGNAGGAR